MSDNPKFQAVRDQIAEAERKHGRVLRLSDAQKVDRLGGLDIPWALFTEGEILLIDAAIDAEKHVAGQGVDPAGTPGFDAGFVVVRDRILARDNALLEANDRDNAKRFRARYPEKLIDVRGRGFYAWNGRHWDHEGAEASAFHMAGVVAAHIHEEAQFLTDANKEEQQKKRDRRHTFAKNTGNHRPQTNMLEQLRTMCSHGVDDLDRDRMRIAVNNGTLQLRRIAANAEDDCALSFEASHDPAHLVSQCLDVDYDPDAPCPRWTSFIEQMQPEPERRVYLQIWAGLCLTGLMDHQAIVVHYGTGANGKSLFGATMAALMGNSVALVAPESILGKNQRQGAQASPDLVRLIGKRCVQVHEYPLGEVLDEATVKRLTGGEKIVVRELHQRSVEMEPRFKLEIYCNDKPRIRGTSDGIWRRVNLVNWPVTIPEEERRPFEVMLAEFAEERSGILRWLLDGAMLYLERGLRAPASVKEATAEYRDDSDPVGVFIRDCVDRVPEQNIGSAYMHDAFKRWAAWNGIPSISNKSFTAKMEQHKFQKFRSNGAFWRDVRLHDVPQADLHDPHAPGSGSDE